MSKARQSKNLSQFKKTWGRKYSFADKKNAYKGSVFHRKKKLGLLTTFIFPNLRYFKLSIFF